jgi:ADP-ribose pyrophosphatase
VPGVETMLKPWTILESEGVLKTSWFEIRKDRCKTGEGVEVPEYYTWKKRDCVIVFPITVNEQVILIRQYRHGVHNICVDFPGGTIEDGQSVLDAASEELIEETCYRAERLIFIGTYCMDSSYSSQKTHFVVAKKCRKVINANAANTNEITEVFTVPLCDFQDFSDRNIDCLLCSLLASKGIKYLA